MFTDCQFALSVTGTIGSKIRDPYFRLIDPEKAQLCIAPLRLKSPGGHEAGVDKMLASVFSSCLVNSTLPASISVGEAAYAQLLI